MNVYEKKVYSQNGEDGVIERIFDIIGTDSKVSLEFGVQNGAECNTRYLAEKNWYTMLFDSDCQTNPLISEEYFTAENINKIFADRNVPKNLDLLSIDIDSNDLWVWNALSDDYKPRLVVIEYNSKFSPEDAVTVEYDPKLQWDGSDYMGASLKALNYVAKKKGYSLVYCENRGVNAFFVRNDLISKELPAKTVKEAYKAPQYGLEEDGVYKGHYASKRKMITIDENLNQVK